MEGELDQVNIHQAKTQFSRLVERAESGERILIARSGRPAAMLVPLDQGRKSRPGGGSASSMETRPGRGGDVHRDMTESIDRLLDRLAESGEPGEVSRHGRRFIVIPRGRRRLDLASLPRREAIACTPDELVDTSWEHEWHVP